MYGDDLGALLSPSPSTPASAKCQGTDTYPHHVVDPNAGNAPLLHASYPFRTIAAAVAYIPPLPTPPSPVTNVVWKYAIIHLLPGMYARAGAYPTPGNHTDNNLKVNGEVFPIRLPPGVSIQGTSALNTVIDVAGNGPAFEFGNAPPGQPLPTGVNTFIDSVTILGATNGGTTGPYAARLASAIYIGPNAGTINVNARPTISNCFLVANRCGVFIAGDRNDPSSKHDGVVIVNNTFAFNWLGLYNGQMPFAATPVTGVSKLVLINNIFDSGHPSDAAGAGGGQCYWPAAMSRMLLPAGPNNFEGVSDDDLNVTGPAPAGNFNAYEWAQLPPGGGGTRVPNRYNNGAGGGGNSLAGIADDVTLRQNMPLPPTGGRNLAPITGWVDRSFYSHRGILYVRDLICNWKWEATSPQLPPPCPQPPPNICFDLSPLDFRLAPAIAPATQSPGSGPLPPPSLRNPLVNNGWSSTTPVTVQMANGVMASFPPGALAVSDWPHHSWQHDCEGVGNPRIKGHVLYPAMYGLATAIDIGADEMGETIMAGYVFGTTSFVKYTLANSTVLFPRDLDNKYVWFLGLPTAIHGITPTTTPNPMWPARPRFREIANQWGWYSPWTFNGAPTIPYVAPVVDVIPHLLRRASMVAHRESGWGCKQRGLEVLPTWLQRVPVCQSVPRPDPSARNIPRCPCGAEQLPVAR